MVCGMWCVVCGVGVGGFGVVGGVVCVGVKSKDELTAKGISVAWASVLLVQLF